MANNRFYIVEFDDIGRRYYIECIFYNGLGKGRPIIITGSKISAIWWLTKKEAQTEIDNFQARYKNRKYLIEID